MVRGKQGPGLTQAQWPKWSLAEVGCVLEYRALQEGTLGLQIRLSQDQDSLQFLSCSNNNNNNKKGGNTFHSTMNMFAPSNSDVTQPVKQLDLLAKWARHVPTSHTSDPGLHC